MKYFRNKDGLIFGYDADQIGMGYPLEPMTELTADEVDTLKAPLPRSRSDIEWLRLVAYSNPVSGSDRFRAEAEAERLSGNDEKAASIEKRWLDRRIEIANQYPWPEEK